MKQLELAKNPAIRDVARTAFGYMREKPLWTLAGVAVTTAWILQYNGQLVLPQNLKQYKPDSQEAKDLLTNAAIKAGLPQEWGSNPDTHWIMQKESKGFVGIPNYTYGTRRFNRNRWPEVWAELKSGVMHKPSTATGLGQLLIDNVRKFYPNGVNGIGDPMNEAVGFLKYIDSRYGSPTVARSVYGQIASYTHGRTGKSMNKSFKEGY